MEIICPKCKGRRKVFNPECLFLTICAPIAMFVDWLDGDDGYVKMSKRDCPTCKGKGRLTLRD